MTFPKRLLVGISIIGGIGLATVTIATATTNGGASGPTSAELSAMAPKVGEPAPVFTAVDTRGTSHALEAYKGRWVVLEWVNHSCPYTKKHYKSVNGQLGNTQAMQRDYMNKVVWLSVVSSARRKQGFTSAKQADELTKDKGAAPTALIRDTAGSMGRLYGARTTPQYAIIDPQGVLRYAGAVDSKSTSNVKDLTTATNYVRAALDAGLAGKPIAVTQTQPYGCDVKY